MNRLLNLAFAAVVICVATVPVSAVDSSWNYAVELAATVQSSPARITLTWKQDSSGTPDSYTIYRKLPLADNWGSPIAVLGGGTTSYADTNVVSGPKYEYQVFKDYSSRGYRGYGYIEAGINVTLVESRGTVVLIVDNAVAGGIGSELQRLQADLVGDGWGVIRHDVGRGDSVTSVKNLIRTAYNADPSRVNTVFLVGHVPVPYSGLMNPDGHPDHRGAWPADVYYGELDGQWTDSSVNSPPNGNTDPVDAARMRNVPGDGKFDQSTPPGLVRLQVGRVDMYDMPGYRQFRADPSFASEIDLLKQYFNKDHAYRHGQRQVQRRALIGDYTGDHDGIAAAATGFRSFAPIVGASNIRSLNVEFNDARGVFQPTLRSNDYLFALGSGAGSYSTISGLGLRGDFNVITTTDVVSDDLRAAFVLFFGSWNGDWDTQDSIMRGILATPTYGLAAMYTGVPHWFLHSMGLGETLGYVTRLTQNNAGLYQHPVNLSAHGTHLALMGDPTLRLFPVTPASNLTASYSGSNANLSWTASPDSSLVGYHVYRQASPGALFNRLTDANSPVTQTSYTDSQPQAGATYMVRAVKLETTPSGTYFNASQGVFVSPSGSPDSGGGNTEGPAPTGARLVNLSVRARAGTGNQTLIVGFVVGGAGTSGTLPLLVRAGGPSIRQFGVDGVLPDPVLTVYSGSNPIGQNNNWGANSAQVTSANNLVGAYHFTDTGSADAALVASNGVGGYTVHITDANGGAGVALAELYDAAGSRTDSTPRLVNVAARSQVGTGGDILIVGFVIVGTTPERVLIRGIGPGLSKFGVSDVLTRPQLRLYNSNQELIATNTAWDSSLASRFNQIGAAPLDVGSADNALLVTLPPGAYTAQVKGENDSTGVALAEVYEVR